jgi:hypothetical protein
VPSSPSNHLREFAESISSATDPTVAEWQERGLENPATPSGVVAWSIMAMSVTAGLIVLALGFRAVVLPTIHLLFEPDTLRPNGGILALAFALAVLAASGITAFAVFQGGSRLASTLTRRRR